jgi:hypothetical protein
VEDIVLNKYVGWAVHWSDGRHLAEWETDTPFSLLPDHDQIDAVALFYGPKYWIFRDKQGYFAGKSASVTFPSGQYQLEACFIGYWEDNKKMIFSVDIRTGEPKLTSAEG